MIGEKQLIELVGEANVSHDPDTLQIYSGDMSFVDKVRPAFIVKVPNPESIQKLVSLARETSTPLVPVSSGQPHFRGDTVPSAGGSVVVDLSGLKKILWVNRENRVVMVEPGVTFGELIPAAAKQGLRLNMPLMPRQSKSVLGSMLEREPVIMPKYHWDIADPLASTEVIFGTGDVFRTGSAAGPGTIEEQRAAGGAQKEAAGPSSASWYRMIQGSQGTMGIVTWASARCEIIPRLEEPFFVFSSKLDSILETIHWLIRLRLVNECLVLNNINFAALMSKKGNSYENIKNGLPPWILFFNIAAYDYLPDERLKGQILDMEDLLQRLGMKTVRSLGGVSAFEFLEAVRHPSKEPYWKLRLKGGCEDIFFITIYDRLNRLIELMSDAAEEQGYPAADIGIYLQPVVQGVNCHCEFNIFYNPESRKELQRVKDLSINVIKPLMANGAFFSRPYGEAAKLVLNADAATVIALKKVKAIVDPANIMNSGKLCF
jgi:FAD/FMN-containing dehydrogenase